MFDQVTVCEVTKFVTQVGMWANAAIRKASAGKGTSLKRKKLTHRAGFKIFDKIFWL